MNRSLFWASYKRSGNGNSPRKFAKLVRYPFLISDTEETSHKPDRIGKVMTQKEQHILHSGIYQTWCQIAPDMERNAVVGRFKLTNMVAVETCIDCDNLSCQDTMDGKAADEIVTRLLKQFEYTETLEYLCKIVQLR